MGEEELEFKKLLEILPDSTIKFLLKDYINQNIKHSEYISFITELCNDYINNSNKFITEFKRNVNALYLEEQLGHNIFKNIDIDKTNWFWYARLLKSTEEENFPKSNYFTPKYLVDRLYNIIKDENYDGSEYFLDKELNSLRQLVINLYEKENNNGKE